MGSVIKTKFDRGDRAYAYIDGNLEEVIVNNIHVRVGSICTEIKYTICRFNRFPGDEGPYIDDDYFQEDILFKNPQDYFELIRKNIRHLTPSEFEQIEGKIGLNREEE